MSLSSLLSIARSALLTHKRAMEVTANNVANAQTPGYSRQRLELKQQGAVWTADGLIGRGVTSGSVTRARDQFYDASFRRENGLFSQSSTLRDGLRQIEDAIGEPSNTGLSAAMDRLFHSFSDLANDPASPAARDLVVRAGDQFATQMNQLDTRVLTAGSDAQARLDAEVKQVNELLRQIANLNRDILAAGGSGAVDLQDQRDLAIDALSQMMTVRVVKHDDGTVTVMGEESNLVDRVIPTQLSLTNASPNLGIVDSGGVPLSRVGGSMGGALEIINRVVPDLRTQLDALAENLVTEMNAIHRNGFTATGATNTDFFDSGLLTAGSITLASPLRVSSSNVAAGGSARPGDGSIALRLAQLGSAGIGGLAGRTFRDYYSGVAAGVGLAVDGASTDAEVQQALMDQADQQRTAVSGVSVDEEMVNLISQQQAFGAAAKIVTIADDMMKTILQTI
ncbi:MAG: flagellar hook-associated protein FlgK [Gemmatimonadetes bacterium]|nr:flagellar hook-associated protein FlgK [Gemmatimonadota bacterium]